MSSLGTIPNNRVPAPGWKGGFSTSNPAFAYPNPDLSSLPMTGNMDNITKLQRQIHVLWPEFTWLTVPGDESSRCFQMFAPDISRGGYDDKGRFWSIICPQQGSYSPTLGSLNIEVTVTGQRGWMDESVPNKDQNLLAADMSVTGKVWFAPPVGDSWLFDFLKWLCESQSTRFPFNKQNAVEVPTFHPLDPKQPIINVRSGETVGITSPDFARHPDEAWGVANVAVTIGSIQKTGIEIVDDFNAMVMDIVNLASGNILQAGNTLTWNVWFDAPDVVDQKEWANHAEKWRKSIDTGHGSPDGQPTSPRYFDGSPFEPIEALATYEWERICAWVKKHFGITLPDAMPAEWGEKTNPQGIKTGV